MINKQITLTVDSQQPDLSPDQRAAFQSILDTIIAQIPEAPTTESIQYTWKRAEVSQADLSIFMIGSPPPGFLPLFGKAIIALCQNNSGTLPENITRLKIEMGQSFAYTDLG